MASRGINIGMQYKLLPIPCVRFCFDAGKVRQEFEMPIEEGERFAKEIVKVIARARAEIANPPPPPIARLPEPGLNGKPPELIL